MKHLVLFIFIIFYATISFTEEVSKAKHFGYGIAWLNFDYPSSFIVDPKSHKGESKWWAKLDDPVTKLSIECNSFGFVSEALRQDGFKSPYDYLMQKKIDSSATKTDYPSYYRFQNETSKSVKVIYVGKNIDWGVCYQELKFTFPDGSFFKHKDVIKQVIDSTIPSF